MRVVDPERGKHMTQAELDAFRGQLLALRQRLRVEVSDLGEEAFGRAGEAAGGGLSSLPDPLAHLGTDDFDQQMTLALLAGEGQALAETSAALARIEGGSFGRCERCHREIPRARLEVLPCARHCIGCARRSEGSVAGAGMVGYDERLGGGSTRPARRRRTPMPIKRGDRLLLNQQGVEVPVEAASDEKDGSLLITYTTFSTVSVADVRPAVPDAEPEVKGYEFEVE
jgi:RNA polymerase-binding transcription factor DksA